MKIKNELRNFKGEILGYIETDTTTGDKIGKDFYQRVVGYYDAKQNVTRDFYKVIVYKGGDGLVALIEKEKK